MRESLPNKLPEVIPEPNNPFADDRLKRSQYAQSMTAIVDTYSETGCTMSINGEWGTGKTTFVKMWQAYLEQSNYRTIYFNAWENDYVEDPLIALLGELSDIIGDNEQFRNVASSIVSLLTGAGKSFIKNVAKIDIDDFTKPFEDAISEYGKQKESLASFKKNLIEYVAFVDENKKTPLVFIIDELDRCNPYFAVKTLERVKHLFDIPNIIFVMPICKSQLECSIQGFYGSEKIDAANYLRRFIDLEYELPAPDYKSFTEYLYNRHHFESYFQRQTQDLRGEEVFKIFTEKFCRCTGMELRTMDKVFVLSRLVATQVHGLCAQDMDWIFLLCFIKLQYYDLYYRIRKHDLTLQQLLEEIESVFPKQLLTEKDSYEYDYHTFIYALASFFYVYNRSDSAKHEQGVLPSRNDPEMKLKCNVIDAEKLQEALISALSVHPRWTTFKEITDRIDLLRII